jgi:signal transduction histidine kinase
MDSATSSSAVDEATDSRVPLGLLASIGHELRTPLASIRGFLETLLDGECDASTARRFLETARRETLRLGRLVDGLIEFSPLDLSAERCAPCDVVEQIGATVEMLRPIAAARRVAISAQLPETMVARVDADACVHALTNLIENALKHGKERGKVALSCAREGAFVAVAVDDDGAGIVPETRGSIFAMGVRGRAASCAGSGIGLAIVKAIAERAGGGVRVEPSQLGGARFVVRFPAG